jgi:hypothetical protein
MESQVAFRADWQNITDHPRNQRTRLLMMLMNQGQVVRHSLTSREICARQRSLDYCTRSSKEIGFEGQSKYATRDFPISVI